MRFLEVLAHGGEEVVVQAVPTLDWIIRANSIKFSIIAATLFLILTAASILIRKKSEWLKYLLFGSFVAIALSTTIYLAGSTIYLNQQSSTGGPVHWHADFEIWNCGKEVELKDPEGLSNKIGSSVVHEHNDKRIHIEGVILEKHQASLEHFFASVGGSFDNEHLSMPTSEGVLTLETGNVCPDGTIGELQVFVFKTSSRTFYQQKLTSPQNYVISPESKIPPGDCIIFEFGPQRDRTDKLCNFYEVAIQKREILEQSRE